ncbi:MAG: rhomboid family intramembrane serine protease [Rikenellaceae bacterium]
MSITLYIILITVIVSFLCFQNRDLFLRLSLNPYSIIKKNQWYRLLTHGFVHADFTHLLVNMFVLWSFGSAVEELFSFIDGFGAIAFLFMYLGALVFSSIPDLVKHKGDYLYNSIGASGAVAAVLFASIFFNPWGMIYLFAIVPIPSIIFGVSYVAYEQYMSKRASDNINHSAHIWGALFGVLYIIVLKPDMVLHFINSLLLR